MPMHEDQVDVRPATARALVDQQFPQWRQLPLRPLQTTATVNSIFRLGEHLSVRFPLLAQEPGPARVTLQAEADASAEFAAVSPVPAPEPIALGAPGHGYELPWSVQTWVPGRDALTVDPAGSSAFAEGLAQLLLALRGAESRGRRFTGNGRGGHLADHDEWMEECFSRSEELLDVRRLRALWAELRCLPEVDEDVMSHGDLTPPNVLVDHQGLAGVLDSGGFAAADPALDLVSVWHLLERGGRDHVRQVLDCSDVQWRRGMAWALQQAMGLVWYYAESNPAMSRWGRRSIERLLSATELGGQRRG